MYCSRKLKHPVSLVFMFALFIQGCVTMDLYQGPELGADGIAVLKAMDKDTSISGVDGKPTTSEASFAVKGKFEQEVALLPGKHRVILIHGGWREVSSKAVYELDAQQGHTYLVRAKTVGKNAALWMEEEKSAGRVGSIVASFNEPVLESGALDTYTSVYSFLAPKEPGWVIKKRMYNNLVLFKEGSKEDESFVISITDGQIPTFKDEKELIDALEEKDNRAPLPARHKSLERKVEPGDPSDFCYDIYTMLEDHDAKRKSARTDMMLMETAYRRCRQQDNRNMLTEIYYSHRHYPGEKDPDFMAKAQAVFTSLKFK